MTNETAAAIESLWTVQDVANFLRCSTSLVYKKAEAATIPCVRMGALLRFDPPTIRTWALNGGKTTGTVVPFRRG